jgi:hypothetical protein
MMQRLWLALLLLCHLVCGLQSGTTTSRRRAFASVASSGVAFWGGLLGLDSAAFANEGLLFEKRDRESNKGALIRDDYWYMTGKIPPRLLTNSLQGDEPPFNAFGSCVSADGGNPCSYVSLKQRGPAYTKYAYTIAQGAKEYQELGRLVRQATPNWEEAINLLRLDMGAAAVDAELKLVLLATALTTSPNFPIPSRELLVARYYSNEVHYAQQNLRAALEARNPEQALATWEYGRDSWNSYFQVINRSISAKVGDKFALIA